MSGLRRQGSVRALLEAWLDAPDLPTRIAAMPARAFGSLLREVGLEDAGMLVALATDAQLVQAFDEDLFVNEAAGERETLDTARFATWLEVLLEAGDERAAERFARLDRDFVIHALSGLCLVFDEEALRLGLAAGDEDDACRVDKALASALSADLDGYIVVARVHEGWDATLSLLLALDRFERALLERVLERLAVIGAAQLEDLDDLWTLLSEGESLAEDVEAAREERRARQGFVEPRAARAFLKLARVPEHPERPFTRDALTQAYFRSLPARGPVGRVAERLPYRQDALAPRASNAGSLASDLARLSAEDPTRHDARMEELAYLANVLLAGHERDGARLSPVQAFELALATVAFGIRLQAEGRTPYEVLRDESADLLFRRATSSRSAKGLAMLAEPEPAKPTPRRRR